MQEYEEPSQSELDELLHKTFTSDKRTGYITVQDFTLPNLFPKFQKQINDFEVLNSDIWMCGHPKTGTTWLSEITWLIANDFDYEGAKLKDYFRTVNFDLNFLTDLDKWDFGERPIYNKDSINFCKNMKKPRSILSNLPLCCLPKDIKNGIKKPRIIYTVRDPIDVCAGYYHMCVNSENFRGTFEEFCKLFLFGKINYGPYYKHVSSFWKARKNLNILFITLAEMQKDVSKVIRKVAKFLNKTITDEEVLRLQKYASFENMINNPAVTKQGPLMLLETAGHKALAPFKMTQKDGGHKNSISAEYIQKFEFYMKRWFEETGIDFYEIQNSIYTDIKV